ncbi:carbohydrate kinase family protein [Oscillospiraceae bacterium LTW-04]|nr:carbohydrate kinase [Oscillospiraceae bacterium MB24-C1]
MYDVTAIGELLIDFATLSTDKNGYPTMAAKPGGAPVNYLAALTAYGRKTAFLGKVGADTFGGLLVEAVKQAGIETGGILQDPTVFTTLAFVTFDKNGNRTFSFARKPGADTCLRFEELDLSFIDAARTLHFGTLSLTDEPARTATQQAVVYAKQKGKLITYDPNLRLSLWRSPQEAEKQILWGLSQADIVKISDDEVRFLWGCDQEEGAMRILEEYGAQLAMVTLGPKGCYLKNRRGAVFCPSIDVKTIDTTGAGDIFGGSAVSRILGINKSPSKLTLSELGEVARFASAASSLSTCKMGGIPSIPPMQEVLEAIEKNF